jgi:urease accessory protein
MTFERWLDSLLEHSIATLDLPILLRLQRACETTDWPTLKHWCNYLVASRETMELRKEERQRGAALLKLLPDLGINLPASQREPLASTQLAGMALAATQWGIPAEKTCSGYAWSWLESTVMAGVKLIPLGQTQGQQLTLALAEKIPAALAIACNISDSGIGSSTPAQAIASSRHETQYTRLFRS